MVLDQGIESGDNHGHGIRLILHLENHFYADLNKYFRLTFSCKAQKQPDVRCVTEIEKEIVLKVWFREVV